MFSAAKRWLFPVGVSDTGEKHFLAGYAWSKEHLSVEEYREWVANQGPWAGKHLGIGTGDKSGNIICIDVDDKNDVDRELQAKHLKALDLPETLVTPSFHGGGRHYWFFAPFGFKIKTGSDVYGDGSGIDIRGDGGMVILYPDMEKAAKEGGGWWPRIGYEHYEVSRIAALPRQTAVALRKEKKKKQAAKDNEPAWDGGEIKKGNRDEALRDIIWKWVHTTTDFHILFYALLGLNADKVRPPVERSRLEYMLIRALEKRSTNGLTAKRSSDSEWE